MFASNLRVFSTSRLDLVVVFLYVSSYPVIIPCRSGKGISPQPIVIVVTVTSVLRNPEGGKVGTRNKELVHVKYFTIKHACHGI